MRYGSTESDVGSKYRHESSSSMIPVQRRTQSRSVKLSKAKFRQRLMGLVAGSIFVPLAIQVTVQMFQSSYGIERLVRTYALDDSMTMREWVGTTTIFQSPLVMIGLQGHTEPINDTIYVQSHQISSFRPCQNLNARQQEIYSDQWQRLLYSEAVVGTAYNITFLNDIELIAPVVNCDSAFIRTNDSTRGKFYFLTRTIGDSQNVQLLTLAMAVQEYWITSETQVGSAAVASLTLVTNLQSDHVLQRFIVSLGYPFYQFDFSACNLVDNGESDFFFQLQTIPRDPKTELSKLVKTSYRSGFYLTAQTGHYNIRRQIWLIDDTALGTVTTWRWKSQNTSRNTWSWVHLFDSVFAVYVVGHIFQQLLILQQAFREGILWCVDGSVTVTKPMLLRGTLVVVLWCLTSFWDLTEFCMRDAHEIADIDQIYSFTEAFRMDTVNIMFSYTSYLARITKERVDVGFVFVTSIMIFIFRTNIIKLFPSVVASIKELTIKTAEQELRSSSIYPMQLRAPYKIVQYPTRLMVHVLTPLFIIFPVIVVFIILRKVGRRLNPPNVVVQQSSSAFSKRNSAESLTLVKSAFTNFELATGSELEVMYGVLGDFDNYLFIKGMKFASADGVYGACFVIVNKKFLVHFNDIWSILLMKLLRVRFTKVYIFSLNGTTVKQTALLAYPETMTVRDLMRLSCTTLS